MNQLKNLTSFPYFNKTSTSFKTTCQIRNEIRHDLFRRTN